MLKVKALLEDVHVGSVRHDQRHHHLIMLKNASRHHHRARRVADQRERTCMRTLKSKTLPLTSYSW